MIFIEIEKKDGMGGFLIPYEPGSKEIVEVLLKDKENVIIGLLMV